MVVATVVSGKNMAWFFSGTEEECMMEEWGTEQYADASTARNMDGSHLNSGGCIKGQPTDKPRKYIWVPKIDKDYCLVMSNQDSCPAKGSSDVMVGQTLDLFSNRISVS